MASSVSPGHGTKLGHAMAKFDLCQLVSRHAFIVRKLEGRSLCALGTIIRSKRCIMDLFVPSHISRPAQTKPVALANRSQTTAYTTTLQYLRPHGTTFTHRPIQQHLDDAPQHWFRRLAGRASYRRCHSPTKHSYSLRENSHCLCGLNGLIADALKRHRLLLRTHHNGGFDFLIK